MSALVTTTRPIGMARGMEQLLGLGIFTSHHLLYWGHCTVVQAAHFIDGGHGMM